MFTMLIYFAALQVLQLYLFQLAVNVPLILPTDYGRAHFPKVVKLDSAARVACL